jgi:hypothetical protein
VGRRRLTLIDFTRGVFGMVCEANYLLGHGEKVIWDEGCQLLCGYRDNGHDYVLGSWHCLVGQARHAIDHLGLLGGVESQGQTSARKTLLKAYKQGLW